MARPIHFIPKNRALMEDTEAAFLTIQIYCGGQTWLRSMGVDSGAIHVPRVYACAYFVGQHKLDYLPIQRITESLEKMTQVRTKF